MCFNDFYRDVKVTFFKHVPLYALSSLVATFLMKFSLVDSITVFFCFFMLNCAMSFLFAYLLTLVIYIVNYFSNKKKDRDI